MVRSSVSRVTLRLLFFATCMFFYVCSSVAQNPIITENALTGAPRSEWDISGAGDPNIQGFATDISVNRGGTVRFKIDVTGGGTYTIRIYRLGYYQGNGARLVTNLGTFAAVNQPEPSTNTSTGLVDCGNWSESASWPVPSTAVSGVYIARLTRSTGSSHIAFIVRDDAGNAPVLFKTSDATWQAYNGYGGNSLYTGATSYPSGHAVKVSYNRPFITREGGAGGGPGEDWLFNAEYPMIRFLERNGYHVSYTTDVDMERSTTPITPAMHKVFLSVGHDEYWSAAERTRIENARNAGVHLAFFSGNEVYWKTRWEDNNRTLVCYKEGTLGEINCGTKCDPNVAWTGLWRDGCSYPAAGACKPENALTGQISWTLSTGAIAVPGAYRNHRFWRNTSVALQAANGTVTLPNGTLGYEWDFEQYPETYPNGRIVLSNTTLGGLNHKLSLYRHSSGALVFGAGTVQWAWGLDNNHDRGNEPASAAMQQATINLLADMGVQPGSIMQGMIASPASSDFSAPVPVITSPSHNATVNANTTITVSGTSTDAGGVVAGIEVSVDGGNTWILATGTSNWSYSFTPAITGTVNIRVRGFDDSGNMSVPGSAGTPSHISINVTGGSTAGSYNIFQPSAVPQIPFENDGSGINLGVKFRTTQSGFISGIRYYKGAGTTGTHTGTLWSATGQRLAEVVFVNETSSGWQQAMFSAPVAVNANTTYVASYYSSSGDYCSSNPYFTTAVVNGPLRALANGEDGNNGLYLYGSVPAFPTSNYGSSNYFVDVVFNNITDSDPPVVNAVSPAANAGNVSRTATITVTFSEDMLAGSISPASFVLRDAAGNSVPSSVSYNSSTRSASLTPAAPLNYLTSYTASVTGGTPGVKDLAGNALVNNYSWTFTTMADVTGPVISSVSPVNAASLVNVNTQLTGLFNEAMDASTISSSNIQLAVTNGAAVAGSVVYNIAYHSFTFTPDQPLLPLTGYTATITTGVKDAAGNSLAANYSWSFTTEPEPDLQAPVVVTVVPAAGSTGVPLNAVISADLNEDMQASSITGASVELRDAAGNLVAATVTYNSASRRILITPSPALLNSTSYSVLLKSGASGIKDFSGNALAADYTWSFTSIADEVPPQIQGVSPAPGSSGVAVNTAVTIQFNEAMNAASISATSIELRDAASNLVAATITYNPTTRLATLQPAAPLQNAVVYTLIVKNGISGVKDVAGNSMAAQYVAYFTTTSGTTSIFPSTATPASFNNDGQALVLGLKFRSSQAGQVVGVRFYKAPGDNGVHTGNLWNRTGTKLAEVVFSNETASGWQQAYFTTPVSITANTTYVISYHSSNGNYSITNPSLNTAFTNGPLRALANGEDGGNGVYRYSATPQFPSSTYQTSNYFVDVLLGTASAPDQTAPLVTSVVPANNTFGVSLTPEIKVVFNEAMNFASISSSSVELRNASNALVPVTVSYDAAARTASLAVVNPLSLNTTYRIVVKSGSAGVKDVAGNALAVDYSSNFTTLADQTPPTVVSASPANLAVNIDPGTNIAVVFSEAMLPASLNGSSIYIQSPGGTVVAASLNYDAGNFTAVLQPATPLQRNVSYSVTILGGSSGVKDLGGNPLASDYSFSFTIQPDIVAPAITLVTPASGAVNVPLSLQATVLFSEEIDAASLAGGNIEVIGAFGQLSFNTQYNPVSGLLQINLVDSLQYLAQYTIRIRGGSTGVKDLAGNALAADYTWSFTTRPDMVPPVVVNSTPASGSTGHAVAIVPTIQFSETMLESSLNATSVELRGPGTTLQPVAIHYNPSNQTVSIQPANDLPYATSFTVTIKAGANGVKDLAGNSLANDFTSTFSTMNEPDFVAPVVLELSPAPGATSVLLNAPVTIRFSEPVHPAGLIAANFDVRDSNGQPVPFSFATADNNSLVTLQPNLGYATLYTVSVVNGLADMAGNTLAPFSFAFTTLADVVPPVVLEHSPMASAAQVPVETPIIITFSEPLLAGSVSSNTVGVYNSLGIPVSSTITYNGLNNRISIQPQLPFAHETVYSVVLTGGTNGISDLQGNVLASDYTWSFTTAPFIDIIPPLVVSVSPVNNAQQVPATGTMTVQFSEDMDVHSLNTTSLELRNAGGVLISAAITYNAATRLVTIVPSSPLGYSTMFTMTVKAGLNGVKDLAGNPLLLPYSWNFTTEADQEPPQVASVDPMPGAVSIATNTAVNIRFTEAMLPASLTAANIELSDALNNIVAGTVNYFPGTYTLIFTPSSSLKYSTAYAVRVKSGASGVKDAAGNALAADYTWNFTTEADIVAPAITSVTPANGSTGVPVASSITAVFSEAMDASTIIASNIELRNSGNVLIPAGIVYNNANQTVTITPNSALTGSTVFQVLIKTAVKDAAGNGLPANYTWSFTSANTSVSIFQPNTVPAVFENDGTALSLGMKFRTTQAGYITAIRYYKPANATGTRTGNLWSSSGTKLAEVIFTNETTSGWQQAMLGTPVAVSANITYVVSYHSSSGDYANTNPYFTSAVVNGPLRALAAGEDGGNGVYRYTSTPAFPNSTYQSSNYWVDVVFAPDAGPDLTAPAILSLTPGAGAVNVANASAVAVTFSETVAPASFASGVFELRDAANVIVPATLTVLQNQATLTPLSALSYMTTYTVRLRGGTTGVKDVAGNALARDTAWTFTVSDPPPPPVTANGPGGPVLVLYSPANPFSRYSIEMLRAEGLNYYLAKDIATITQPELNNYDMVILGEVAVNSNQVAWLTDWVNAGGTLVAFRPHVSLSSLMGITRQAGTVSDQYLLVNTASGPGQGIVNQTIQFHGTADLYTLSGAVSLATLYSSASTPTVYPAVTQRLVGSNGGKAVAFAYDLAKSIVYTRQGNPAWAGQKRDGTSGPIRSDDLFFGDSSPDWVNLDKVAIPQADEQQRLLVNILLQGSLHRKPLPRFWFLPKGLKAAIVMTGDDHAHDGTTGRFNQYLTLGPNSAQDVANWNAIRGTSYVFNGTPISNTEAQAFESQGFEISLHLNTNCENYTPASFESDLTSQLAQLAGQFPGISQPVTHRTHCLVWSDWATTAKVQAAKGIRLDVNYYYWPGSWVQNRSGMFTGSGMPMRFADLDGTLIDCYQAATQMTDESGITLPRFADELLTRALGAEGYYGVFVANMHTDTANHIGSNSIISSARARNIPVISAKQLLTWLDGRNNSYFGAMTWNGSQLSFPVTALSGARNLKGMLPVTSTAGTLQSILLNGNAVPYTTEVIKGMSYAFFDIPVGASVFVANYGGNAARGTAESMPVMASQPGNVAEMPTGWRAEAYPNPSAGYFQVKIYSDDKQPVVVRIIDAFGTVVERHEKIMPGSVITIGQSWKNGVYFAEVIQGGNKKLLKLVKTGG